MGYAGYEGYVSESLNGPEYSFGMTQITDGWVLAYGESSGEETWYFAGCVLASVGWRVLSIGWGTHSFGCPVDIDC